MPAIINNNSKAYKTGDAEPPLVAGSSRIYSMRFCPWAERALLYAAAKNIPVEVVNIDLQKKPEWYFKKHYQGKVPAFEKDGKVVIESKVVPEYLDDIFPESSILPADPFLKAQQRILADHLAGVAPAFYGMMTIKKEKLEGEKRLEKITAVHSALDAAEKLLTDQYFGGSTPGYADWLTFPFLERVKIFTLILETVEGIETANFPSVSRWPKLTKWWESISKSEAVKAVAQPEQNFIKFFEGYANGNPNYDEGI